MGRLYCDNDLLDYLFLLDDDEILFKILDEFYDLAINRTEEEIIELVKSNPIANYFFKRDSGNIISDKDSFRKINDKEFEEFSNDILIVSETVNSEDIRKRYGVLALHVYDDPFLEAQDVFFKYSFKKEDSKFNSWADVFKLHPITPVNTAILIDNFLWNNLDDFNSDNLDNLYEILANLIPNDLIVPFKLLIQIDNRDGRLLKEKAKEKAKKIEKYIKRTLDKVIHVGISTQTDSRTFHERVLITNHHYLYSDKGFTVFKNNRIKHVSKGTRNWVFFSIQKYIGELDKHHHRDVIKNVKKSINSNKKSESNTIYNVGYFENPLLN